MAMTLRAWLERIVRWDGDILPEHISRHYAQTLLDAMANPLIAAALEGGHMDGFTIDYKPGLAPVPGFRPFRFTCKTCLKPFWPIIQIDDDPAGERAYNPGAVPDPIPIPGAQANLDAHLATHQQPGA